jgi:hypothetical protein
MIRSKKAISTFAAILAIFTIQVSSLMAAHAADTPSDLQIVAKKYADWNVFSWRVCNNGPSTVTAFEVTNTYEGFAPTSFKNLIFSDTSATSSTIDSVDGSWTGTMASGQCVEAFVLGDVTGNNGDSFSMTSTITSATLSDASANVDPTPGNDSDTSDAATIGDEADLVMATRLLTTGAITSGQNVSYEITVTNEGAGDYVFDPSSTFGNPQIYFLMPEGATFVDLIDTDTGDVLDVDFCFPVGDIQTQLPGTVYSGLIQGCQLVHNSGTTLPSGGTYTFEIEVLTTSGFVSGDTEAVGVIIGNEEDTVDYFEVLSGGGEFLSTPIDNIFRLTFDDTDLIPTINPCSGQGEVVEVDEACFTISFNKDIYGPSFTEDDLVLTGTGTISDFTQLEDNLWEIRVTGMTFGSTLTVSLAEGGILDLSAVANGTQVLGVNTVRYGAETTDTPTDTTTDTEGDTAGTTATGTLPSTGSNTDVTFVAAALLILGYGVHRMAKRRAVEL